MEVSAELRRVAERAVGYADPGEELAGIVPAGPRPGLVLYLCAFRAEDDATSWLVLDGRGHVIEDRTLVRDAVSIIAMCELAEEAAAGGDLDELSRQLVALRLTENPPGISEAEEAVAELQRAIGAPPQVATPARLDAVGAATKRLEQAFGDGRASPFAEAMGRAVAMVEALAADVEGGYKRELKGG
jgi:hypothetical protein